MRFKNSIRNRCLEVLVPLFLICSSYSVVKFGFWLVLMVEKAKKELTTEKEERKPKKTNKRSKREEKIGE